MPRRSRLELPGIPMHITQRGVNRAAVFIDNGDRYHYLSLLRSIFPQYNVALHAYVLMGNHVHLLASSPEAGAISCAMRKLHQCHVNAFNRRHRRTGTLWEGRFKSCLVDTDRYLLTVSRYIELNPVRAAIAVSPEEYRWSSVHAHLNLLTDPVHTPHPIYLALDRDDTVRAQVYREWLYEAIDDDELAAIRQHLKQERVLGDPRFQAMAEKALNRSVCVRPQGRPVRESRI
jgi:putative transposase